MDRKSIFLALFIFIVIIFSLYFTLEENIIIPEPPAADNSNLAEDELEEVEFTIYNDQQNHQLKLSSAEVKNFKSQQRMELKPVEAAVYSQADNELLYTLHGDFAIYYSSQNYIRLEGNVLIDSGNYQIETDQLDYYLERNYLEGSGSVKIRGENFQSEAESFNSDLNLRNLKLSGSSQENKAEVSFD